MHNKYIRDLAIEAYAKARPGHSPRHAMARASAAVVAADGPDPEWVAPPQFVPLGVAIGHCDDQCESWVEYHAAHRLLALWLDDKAFEWYRDQLQETTRD